MLLIYYRNGSEKAIVANGSPTCDLHSPHLGCGLNWIVLQARTPAQIAFSIMHMCDTETDPHWGWLGWACGLLMTYLH